MTLRNPLYDRSTLTHGIGLHWAGGYNESLAYTEIQRAPDDGTGQPDTTDAAVVARHRPRVQDWVDMLPDDGLRRHYRIRHTSPGLTASSWTGWVSAVPAEVTQDEEIPTEPVKLIAGTQIETDGAVRTLPRNPVLATDANGNTLLEDGDSVVFTGFANAPRWWAMPQTVSVWDSTLTTGTDTNLRIALENVTATGATVVAKLQQAGSATNYDDGFSGSAITTVGGTTDSDVLTTTNLPALNDQFTVRGNVEFTNNSTKFLNTGRLLILVYSYDGTTTTATARAGKFVEIADIAPSGTEDIDFSMNVTAPDVDGAGGDKFRLEVYENASSSGDVEFSVTGLNTAGYTTNGVAWQKATITEVAATDATRGSYVSFLLMDQDE
jgi:hypothetical protein